MRKEREQKLVEQWPAWFDTEGDIRQVKEKFGGLGIHLNHANDAIRQRLEAAREESFHTARFAVSREKGGKAIGSRLCAMNTRAHREQENMAELSHEQLWHRSQQKP